SGELVSRQSPQQIVQKILRFKAGAKLQIFSPIIRSQKGEHREELAKYMSMGFTRVRLNGEIQNLDEGLSISKSKFNSIDLMVDRIVMKVADECRITDSVEPALKLSDDNLTVHEDDKEHFFSEKNYSFKSGNSYPDLEPRLFSFNSPLGACPTCNG